ncbi:hypothetical protein SAMN05421820_103796 [Pedobacter steynii]|uniref:Uncharacterized protein n=1 Tax=Pedobacter steynii TaxID=430522 RepID=A0A1G9T587_9SPHI|nr:hypothetical protein SAMN05421820_103796 [Pedobacter steynii]
MVKFTEYIKTGCLRKASFEERGDRKRRRGNLLIPGNGASLVQSQNQVVPAL